VNEALSTRPPGGSASDGSLTDALDALDAVGHPRRGRDERLWAVAELLEEDEEAARELSRRFELSREEVRGHLEAGRVALEEVLEVPSTGRPTRGISLCVLDWRELFGDGLARVARELLRGRAVALLSDERWPAPAAAIYRSLSAAGFEGDELVLVDGARDAELAEALGERRVDALSASGSVERIRRLRHAAVSARIEEQCLRTLRCSAFEVGHELAIEESARQVLRAAFDRAVTLGGQLPGQVALAYVPQRLYSHFTGVLLELLTASPEACQPQPQVDRQAARRARAAWVQGLDEGATMISGGQEDLGPDELRVPPTVFCNVEPHMRSARRQEPLPVLSLVRVS